MEFTRREVMAAGLALGGGCLSSGSNVRYPEAAAGEPLIDSRGTVAQTDGTESAPSNPEFAPATRLIYEETGWFASEYEPALRAYREAVEQARATVARVRNQGDINENTIDVVERRIDEQLLATIRDRILPHFNIAGHIEGETDRHLEVTRTFANRGDIDRAQEELARLETFLDNVGTTTYVNRNLSRNPVRNRLLTSLRGGDSGGELFEVWGPETDFTTYAYGGPSRLREEPPGGPFDGEDQERYESRFAPAVSEDRDGAVYVLSRDIPDRQNQPDPLYPEEHPSNAAVIQAFPDAAAANAARTALVESGPVAVEGRTQLGAAEMERIYYSAVGDVVYAYLFRTAEFLIVVAPSEVAWNERINWSAGLRQTWLWD